MEFNWGENPPVPADLTVPQIAEFRGIFQSTAGNLERKIRGLRVDSRQCIPPVILCSDDQLRTHITRATRNSTRERNDIRFMNLGMHNNCLFVYRDDLIGKMSSDQGKTLTSIGVVHEITHAVTTTTNERGIRCGFTSLPIQRLSHGLVPGEVYDYRIVPGSLEESGGVPEVAVDLRLTENATDLAVHAMLPEMLPETSRYKIVFCNSETQQAFIKKDSYLVETLLRALYKGRRQLLERPVMGIGNPSLLQVLEAPNLKLISVASMRPTADEVFEFTN